MSGIEDDIEFVDRVTGTVDADATAGYYDAVDRVLAFAKAAAAAATPIDHRAAMVEALATAHVAATSTVAERFIGIAQVHATALVAEQARAANLIALQMQMPWVNEVGVTSFVPLGDGMPNDAINEIHDVMGTFA